MSSTAAVTQQNLYSTIKTFFVVLALFLVSFIIITQWVTLC